MVRTLDIYPPDTLILDGVTFCVDFSKVSIEGGHPMGPVFAYGAAVREHEIRWMREHGN